MTTIRLPNAIVCAASLLLLLAGCAHDGPGATDQPPSAAKGSIVKHTISGPFEVRLTPQTDVGLGDVAIGRMWIEKQFHGDLEATSKGQMLGVRPAVKDSAGYVAMERVVGMLAGRAGGFVLQHSSTMSKGQLQQSVTVVPDSGTEGLVGLAGTMTIEMTDGKHLYHFEYWFEGAAQR